MVRKFLLNCQYYENYAFDAEGNLNGEYWKKKGGHSFLIEADSDDVMYADSELFAKICSEQSNEYCKFEFVGIEMAVEPTVLDNKYIETELRNHFQNRNKVA